MLSLNEKSVEVAADEETLGMYLPVLKTLKLELHSGTITKCTWPQKPLYKHRSLFSSYVHSQ